jgi:hypothetical protein
MSELTARLLELEAKATPAPWRALKTLPRVTRDAQAPYPQDRTGNVGVGEFGNWADTDIRPFNKERWLADAALTAALRNALPEIIASLELKEGWGEDLQAIEARVRPTICPTWKPLDDGLRETLEGRISKADFEALLWLASGAGRTAATPETAARAIAALRTPDASLARVPNTVRQSIADVIEGLASQTGGGK